MYKRDAQRFLELQFGYIVNHNFFSVNGFVYGKGGVVVIFEVNEKDSRNVLSNDKINGVFPIEINGCAFVVAALGIVVECVE